MKKKVHLFIGINGQKIPELSGFAQNSKAFPKPFARFFWKIAKTTMLFFTAIFLGNLLKKRA
jgi:hypothetical protein